MLIYSSVLEKRVEIIKLTEDHGIQSINYSGLSQSPRIKMTVT